MDGRSRFRRAAGFCGTVPVIQVPALYPEPKPIEDPAPAGTEPSWRGWGAGTGPVRVLAGFYLLRRIGHRSNGRSVLPPELLTHWITETFPQPAATRRTLAKP